LKEMEEKEHAEKGIDSLSKPKSAFVCPICKTLLTDTNLVDAKSVVQDNLYYVGGVFIADSHVYLYCNFEHRYTEEGNTLENPHPLIAKVKTIFDKKGECICFDILEVHPGK